MKLRQLYAFGGDVIGPNCTDSYTINTVESSLETHRPSRSTEDTGTTVGSVDGSSRRTPMMSSSRSRPCCARPDCSFGSSVRPIHTLISQVNSPSQPPPFRSKEPPRPELPDRGRTNWKGFPFTNRKKVLQLPT